MEYIKRSIVILVSALVFGILGATLLQYDRLIMGAVCMLIAGFMTGTLYGFFIASVDDEEEIK
jgi:hypothetical protein